MKNTTNRSTWNPWLFQVSDFSREQIELFAVSNLMSVHLVPWPWSFAKRNDGATNWKPMKHKTEGYVVSICFVCFVNALIWAMFFFQRFSKRRTWIWNSPTSMPTSPTPQEVSTQSGPQHRIASDELQGWNDENSCGNIWCEMMDLIHYLFSLLSG